MGFGVETDVRDYDGQLVVAHDMPTRPLVYLEEFFQLYKSYGADLTLALNIKSDGLQDELCRLIAEYRVTNYFLFDMSTPEGLSYLKTNLVTFTRQSEYEETPPYYSLADGIWLDEFNGHWINDEIIAYHLSNKKEVCIVSPDLHGRDYSEEWKHYKSIEQSSGSAKIMICTDHPIQADAYFNE